MEGRLSATILKWDHQRTILAKFNLSWFSRFREDLNVIIKNTCMSDLHTPYKLAEGTSSQKNREDMLNYSFPCSCSKKMSSFRLIIKQQWTFLFLVISAILNEEQDSQFWLCLHCSWIYKYLCNQCLLRIYTTKASLTSAYGEVYSIQH